MIDRLTAYAEAGADCLYAPGVATAEEISAVVKAVHPKPVNLLVGAAGPSLQSHAISACAASASAARSRGWRGPAS